jgi:hypothetical protein
VANRNACRVRSAASLDTAPKSTLSRPCTARPSIALRNCAAVRSLHVAGAAASSALAVALPAGTTSTLQADRIRPRANDLGNVERTYYSHDSTGERIAAGSAPRYAERRRISRTVGAARQTPARQPKIHRAMV